jgi:hypothetical protein
VLKKKSKKVRVKFWANAPVEVEFESPAEAVRFSAAQDKSKIRQGFLLYLEKLQSLTNQQVPEALRKSLPLHFHSPTRAFIAIALDGITIRYEPMPSGNENMVIVLGLNQKLAELLPQMSVGLIRINQDGVIPELPTGLFPPTVNLGIYKPTGEQVKTLVDGAQFQFIFPMSAETRSSETSKLIPSSELIRNKFEIGMKGTELKDIDRVDGGGRDFYARSIVKFPLYWDTIAIYPWANYKVWRKADFSSWAERHFYEIAFNTASQEYAWAANTSQNKLRERYQNILLELDALLATDQVKEEQFQQFLSLHPEVIVPGYKKVKPKLAFGSRISDFVFEDATGNYLLVELENPSQELFNKAGHYSSKLTHAKGQVDDWLRYIQDNKATVERELGLLGISNNPAALVVIGRSHMLSVENRRKMQLDTSKTEVITYDDLRSRFIKTVENLLGMLSHVGQNYDVAYHV